MPLEFDRDRETVFERCRTNGTVPSNDAVKLIVLERLMEAFEPGEVYHKSAVNEAIRDHFDRQFTSIRRDLVSFGYLSYDNRANEYRVETRSLSESDVRANDWLARHAKDIGLIE